MPSLTLAYLTRDSATARHIDEDLDGHVNCHHPAVDSTAEASKLAEQLSNSDAPTLLLLSKHSLHSIKGMSGLANGLARQPSTIVCLLPTGGSGEEDVFFDAADAHDRQELQQYWDNQYWSEVRKASMADELDDPEVRDRIDTLHTIKHDIDQLSSTLIQADPVTLNQLRDNFYEYLFEQLDAEEEWTIHAQEQRDMLASLPGISLLDRSEAEDNQGEDAGAVEVGEGPGEQQSTSPGNTDPAGGGGLNLGDGYDLDADGQAAVWISRAWELYEEGQAETALELLAGGKEALPDHPNIAYNYALMLAMDTEVPQIALLELEKLLEEFHDHAGALFLSGELSLLSGDVESAYLDWLQLSDVDPLYPDLNYRLGVLISEHMPHCSSQALTYLRRASRDEPVNGDARYRYAMLLYTQLGSAKKAIKWLKRAIDASPEHAAAHYALAVLHHKRGKLTAARNYFQTAVHLDPRYDTATNQAAFAQKLRMTSDSSRRGAKAIERMHSRISELERNLAEHGLGPDSPSTAPAPAPNNRPGTDKIAFISGASSGIGRATAYALAEDGYDLILLGRRRGRLDELAEDLSENYPVETQTICADIRDRTTLQNALNELPDDWREIDILLNNAGKAKGFDPVHEGDYAHWDEMVDVNLKGLLTLTREVSPLMVKRGEGMIINVCSTAGKEVYPRGNVYCATKHAVDALTYAMRLDLVEHGIRVGQICPAHVEETEFALVRFDGDQQRAKIYEDFQPLRSSDVAQAIRFMINQPLHVNILDIVLQGTQQASSTVVDRSGRDKFSPHSTENE